MEPARGIEPPTYGLRKNRPIGNGLLDRCSRMDQRMGPEKGQSPCYARREGYSSVCVAKQPFGVRQRLRDLSNYALRCGVRLGCVTLIAMRPQPLVAVTDVEA